MAVVREIIQIQTDGRGRSVLWTVLRRTDRSKLFSLTFDRGLNIRENGTWNQALIRKLLLIPEPIFCPDFAHPCCWGSSVFLTLIGKSWKTYPEFLSAYLLTSNITQYDS